jgi:hypothetical protein
VVVHRFVPIDLVEATAVRLVELPAEQIDVLADVVGRRRAGEDDDVVLDGPPQNDLCGRLVVLLGQFLNRLVVEHLRPGQRRRGLDDGVGFPAVLDEIRPLEQRVELDLVDRDRHVRDVPGGA